MKKLLKIVGVVLLAFVAIVVFFIVKNVVDSNRGSNEPPITNNGGNSSGNNNGNDDVGNNNNDKPKEPEKEVYTKYEPVDEIIRKFNVIKVDSSCVSGKDEEGYCLDTPLRINICWFGGGNATYEVLVDTLNMIVNHPDFEKLNKEKKIKLDIDTDYVKPLHGDTTYSFEFGTIGHQSAKVKFTGRIATKDEISLSQEEINKIFDYYRQDHS